MKILKLAFIYIQKACHFALCAVFIYRSIDNSKKSRQFTLRLYIYKNPDTLCYAIFHGIFEIGGGGGGPHFYKQKHCTLRSNFICKKMHFLLRFDIQKARHIASHLY